LEDKDPDSLIQDKGPAAFRSALDAAVPLSEALYGILTEGLPAKTPEQRAALQARLVGAASRIQDPTLAREYRQMLLGRYYEGRRQAFGKRGTATRVAPVHPRPTAEASDATAYDERHRILCAILVRHPGLLPSVGEAFEGLALPERLAGLRDAILDWSNDCEVLDSAALTDHLTRSGLGAELALAVASRPLPLPAYASAAAMPAEAKEGWRQIFDLLRRERLEEDLLAAREEFSRNPTEATQRKLIALTRERTDLNRGEQTTDSDG